ncbi:hypothetical protein EVAR_5021_1 [Eumeta japonica]|uniref:Uncharacterized protein n=1 Tax=Eumeta variegata TaxID=151549 RepID=A0A4C1SUR1_EUMVA|nr:hypothetical protein EVAR_5021_1 [Eumeta japonica]
MNTKSNLPELKEQAEGSEASGSKAKTLRFALENFKQTKLVTYAHSHLHLNPLSISPLNPSISHSPIIRYPISTQKAVKALMVTPLKLLVSMAGGVYQLFDGGHTSCPSICYNGNKHQKATNIRHPKPTIFHEKNKGAREIY